MNKLRGLIDRRLAKFLLVGVINTLVGTAIMFGLYNLAHCSYWVSSAANYILTSILSFFLNKYFTFKQMPVVSSTYWNNVHGSKPEDVMKDEEGLQTMRNLGTNMAWLIKCIEAGKAAGIEAPTAENALRTNFIR